jgi:adenylylsulfate kinase-like enzyme
MIVWINGAYGSGKTTLVAEITRRRSDAVVFDPEHIGYLLRESVPVPIDNFQDLPSWREIVVASLLSLQRHHANLLLVPMTLIYVPYRREVLGALRAADVELLEVFLDVPADELRRRIEHRVLFDDPVRDGDAREFCLSKLEEGVAAAGRVGRDTLVLKAGALSPEQLAQAVLDQTATIN